MNFAHFRDFNADRLPDYRRGLHGLRCGLHGLRRGLRGLQARITRITLWIPVIVPSSWHQWNYLAWRYLLV